jgi:hypothetical protein
MTADQDLAIATVTYRQAWRPVVMGRTMSDPTLAGLAPVQCLCDRLGGHFVGGRESSSAVLA